MRGLVIAALAIAFAPVAALGAPATSLTVKVEGVSDKGGQLRIGIYDKARFLERGSKPVTGRIVAATPGEVVVKFDGLEPGLYGVKLFQDENGNGHIDTVMGMIPSEPFGLSNDAKPSMSGPPWDAAKIALKPGANTTTIHLR